jgi:hypothetical protein
MRRQWKRILFLWLIFAIVARDDRKLGILEILPRYWMRIWSRPVLVVSVRCMYRDFLRLRRLIRRIRGGIELGIVALEWIQELSWGGVTHHQ